MIRPPRTETGLIAGMVAVLLVYLFNVYRMSSRARLIISAAAKYICGVALVGALIFLSAGTLSYFNGWLFIIALFVPMLIWGIVLAVKNADLLSKRLKSKEPQKAQRIVVTASAVIFVSVFIVAGLGCRFGLYMLPRKISVVSAFVLVASYVLYARVMKENPYLNRTVTVEESQKVIDTGLYGVVRHPMYAATLILFLATPLVLGSLYSFLISLAFPFVFAVRIKNEETLLEKELEGYSEYKAKVKYRLIPHIW